MPSSRRYLSIWLGRLPTDRIARSRPPEARTQPLVTVAAVKGGLRLAVLNETAAALGLKPGLALADARARHPAISVVEADDAADVALLRALAERCERYTPLLAIDPPDGLTLDITGCEHLFGGEETLRRDALLRLKHRGFGARAAIAETPGAAWALARFGEETSVETGHVRAALLPLPLAALRLPAETCQDLRRVGLARIADIIDLPRSPLTARFGAELMLRLDQALGRHEEALAHLRPAAAYMAERIFAEPLEREEDILATAEALTLSLGPPMERSQVGARSLELALFRVDGAVNRLEIGTSRPVRDARLVRRLFAEKITAIEGLAPGYGFDVIRLSALTTAPLAAYQLGFGKPRSFEADLALLIDRLAVRLGSGRLIRLAPQDSHVPERAVAAFTPDTTITPSPQRGEGCGGLARFFAPYPKLGVEREFDDTSPTRPIRLFDHPESVEAIAEVPDGPPVRFRWRQRMHRVARAEGPERIALEWWLDAGSPGLTRDYFRVETIEGRRFWLYREGLFGREVEYSRWFMHGLFA